MTENCAEFNALAIALQSKELELLGMCRRTAQLPDELLFQTAERHRQNTTELFRRIKHAFWDGVPRGPLESLTFVIDEGLQPHDPRLLRRLLHLETGAPGIVSHQIIVCFRCKWNRHGKPCERQVILTDADAVRGRCDDCWGRYTCRGCLAPSAAPGEVCGCVQPKCRAR